MKKINGTIGGVVAEYLFAAYGGLCQSESLFRKTFGGLKKSEVGK
jgi:hypothetical protein